MLGEVGENQVGRDRRHEVEPRLPEFPLHVVLGGEAEAAVGLQAHVGRLPGRLRGEVLRHVRLRTDRKSTRLNSSHSQISYAVFCLKKKKKTTSAACYTLTYPPEHVSSTLTFNLAASLANADLHHVQIPTLLASETTAPRSHNADLT